MPQTTNRFASSYYEIQPRSSPPYLPHSENWRILRLLCSCCLVILIAAGLVTLAFVPFLQDPPTIAPSKAPAGILSIDEYGWLPLPPRSGPRPFPPPTTSPTDAPPPMATPPPSVSLLPSVTQSPSRGPRWGEMIGGIRATLTGLLGDIFTPVDLSRPQYLALYWLVYTDPAQLSPLDVNLAQRFVCALIWFAMGGNEDDMIDVDDVGWTKGLLWLTGASECNWEGVKCNSPEGQVIELDMNNFSLKKSIPREIAGLSQLVVLKMADNDIVGTIPDSIGNLINLRELHLYDNMLSGAIPTGIGKLRALKLLYLESNQLSQTIPAEIGNCVNLEDMGLYTNLLTGTIPSTFEALWKLRRMWVSRNALTGGFPSVLLKMPSLQDIYLDENKFDGEIPTVLNVKLPILLDMRINNNFFGGCPPLTLFQMRELRILYMDNNKFACTLFPSIYVSPKLEDLEMSYNDFRGPLPGIPNGVNSPLKRLTLTNNNLVGTVPHSFGRLNEMEKLKLNKNMLSGPIPINLAAMPNIVSLDLSDNQLTGTIPSYMNYLTGLTVLNLSGNQLRGTISPEFKNIKGLQIFQLGTNNLSGSVSQGICDLFFNNLQTLEVDCAQSKVLCNCCTGCT